jgi:hypothetical protein
MRALIVNAAVSRQTTNINIKNKEAKNIAVNEQINAVVKQTDKIQIDIQMRIKLSSKHIANKVIAVITTQFIIAIIHKKIKITVKIQQAINVKIKTTRSALQ